MTDDQFETVAVVYSQPELATLIAALEARDVMVQPVGSQAQKTLWTLAVAFDGVRIRVRQADLGRAIALLTEIADRPAVFRKPLIRNRLIGGAMTILFALLTGIPPPARIPATVLSEQRRA